MHHHAQVVVHHPETGVEHPVGVFRECEAVGQVVVLCLGPAFDVRGIHDVRTIHRETSDFRVLSGLSLRSKRG